MTVVPFVDQSENFRSIATSIEQKHIKRHNQKPGVSRRNENRPSPAFTNISSFIIPLASELFSFRKMLVDRSQDYIFATPVYSKMKSDEREELDMDIREKLSQFESFINQIGHRINSSDGLRNATERSHLLRVHEGLSTYLKEIVDFVSVLKKEHLRRLQVKNRSLSDELKSIKNSGHIFKYHNGIDELIYRSECKFTPKFIDKIEEIKSKYPCLQYKKSEKSVEREEKEEEDDDGWDGIDELEFEDVPNSVDPLKSKDLIVFPETGIRNRKVAVETTQEEKLRQNYEEWKTEQGEEFVEQFQQQTAIIKEEFVKADRDDEIEKLEQQITEIQSLSSVFSEKIMDQERDIDLINDLALHTSENLMDANEWIRKAITNSALRRVINLFCIVVLSFTLLFLDWYNP